MNQQRASRLEPNNQILATPIERFHPLALERSGHPARIERPRQPRVRDLDPPERSPLENGCEFTPDALDLGQLGHELTLVVRPLTLPGFWVDRIKPESSIHLAGRLPQAMTSSSTGRSWGALSPIS